MNFVFDIDGVILDFSKKFTEWMLKNNKNISYNPRYYSYCENNTLKYISDIMDFVHNHINELPLIFPEMPKLMREIRNNGYKIILITAHEGDQKIRIDNLRKLGIEYDEIIFDRNKLPYVQKINPICCVEDSPSMIKKYAEAGYKVAVPMLWNYVKQSDLIKCQNVIGYNNIKELKQILY